MRKRNNFVPVRFSDEELARLKALVEETGQTRNAFILNAISGVVLTTPEYVTELKQMNEQLKSIYTQIRGIAVNVNQMAHHANTVKSPPHIRELEELTKTINATQKELSETCQFIKALIRRHAEPRR